MPCIFFRYGDKDGKYEDCTIDPEISFLQFGGYSGVGSLRGRYQKMNEVFMVEGINLTVWILIDPMRQKI